MKRAIAVILILPLCFFLNAASALCAETSEIVAEGTYVMGDGETPIIAEARAVEKAKRYAVEQAGTYVRSYSRIKNFEVAEDEIEVLASGMLEITILDKKRTLEADAIKFWVKVKAIVKPDKIDVVMERIRENGIGQDYIQLKEAYDKSQEEVAKLKAQLAAAKAEPERKEIIDKIGHQEKRFRSRQLYSDALSHFSAGRMSEALDLLGKAIAENPDFPQAYLMRGFLYLRRDEYDKAIPNLDKVIALAPDMAKAYAGRGICYSRKNRFKNAIADLNQALKLNPGFPRDLESGIHGHLGRALLNVGELRQAKYHLLLSCNMGNQKFCRTLQSPRFKNIR